MKELIQKLCEASGPSGRENPIRDLIQEELNIRSQGKTVVMQVDTLGNLIVKKQGKTGGKKIMLAAHMDEIGLIASYIDEKGFIRFGAIGGLNPLNLNGNRVRFPNGTFGVIGIEKLENPSKIPGLDKLFVDIGARSRSDCAVRIGDIAHFVRPFQDLGDRLVAKAMDDRIGCAVLIQVFEALKSTPHEVFFTFTVQEEVGLRGAVTSGFSVAPDAALAVDVTATGDTPEAKPMAVSLGAGPAVKVKDLGMLSHPGVVAWLQETAEEQNIPWQLEVLDRGTTDARVIQTSRSGIPTGCLSIPCRYVHSPSEMVDYTDVTGAVSLLVALLSKSVPFLPI